jgi:hypothetical protein
MMYQTEINRRQGTPLRLWVYSKLGERKLSRLSPEFDGGLDLRRPEQVRLLRRLRRFGHHGSWTVHVVAADLMLGAVAASMKSAYKVVDKEVLVLTIAGMFHHSGYAVSCTSCIPFGTWYGCVLMGLHRVRPFFKRIDEVV